MQYKRTERKLKQIGNELGVDYVLEGTVRWDKSGEYNQLRINSQLIRVRDDTYLWAESYDRDLSQVFEVQRSIAIEVTEALFTALITSSPWIYIEPPGTHSLQATGTPSRPAVSEKTDPRQEEYKSPQGGFAGKVAFPGESRPTTSLEAYDYYLRGNDYFKRAFAERDLRIAVEMYDKSVRLDPKFVQAYAMLSRAHLGLYWMWYYVESDERLIKARQAVNEALRLNPNLPEVHLALGYYYYWGEQNYDRALKQFTTALELQPNNSDILAAIGTVQGRRGKFEEAIYNLTRASGFDSRNAHKAYVAGMTYLLMRKYKEAERYLNRAISLSPEWPMPYLQKARLYLSMEGDKEKGLEVFKEGFSKIDLAGLVTQASPVDLKVVFGILDAEYLEVLERIPAESFGADRSGYFLFRALLSDRMGRPELRKANHDTARAVLEERVKVRPREPYLHSYLGIAYADLGRKEEAVCEGTKAVELLPALEDAVDGPNWSENLAQIEVMVGEFEAAIDQLEYLLSVPTFFISVPYIRLDPTWAPLRNHRRFQKLVAGK